MSDKVLPFPERRLQPPQPDPTGPSRPPLKWGVYPLGTEDMIVSLPVMATIIQLLRGDDAANRKVMADSLEETYRTYFV